MLQLAVLNARELRVVDVVDSIAVRTYDITKTQYKVSDFLSWQLGGGLDLQPPFQRRSVWKSGAKSFLLDTVARGLPTPIIFLRERIDLNTLTTVREVVDGQQRLRTLLSFVAPGALSDSERDVDDVTIRSVHNAELAGMAFDQLDDASKHKFLNYEFSTHVLPSTVDDREILMIFSRLNSTGTQLNDQELRNASWFGEFKTLMYELGLEQLDRWREWQLIGDDAIARMKEAELTSDITEMMLNGYGGKSQKRINETYAEFDETFAHRDAVARRFRRVMDSIDELIGPSFSETPYRTENWFIPLFFHVYAAHWSAPITKDVAPNRLPAGLRSRVIAAGDALSSTELPPRFLTPRVVRPQIPAADSPV